MLPSELLEPCMVESKFPAFCYLIHPVVVPHPAQLPIGFGGSDCVLGDLIAMLAVPFFPVLTDGPGSEEVVCAEAAGSQRFSAVLGVSIEKVDHLV